MSSAVAACYSISFATNNVTLSSTTSPLTFPSIAFPSRGRRNTLIQRCFVGSKPTTILVAEKIGEASVKLLEDFANVDCSYNMTPEELNTKVSLCDALIVHSETKVGRDVFESSRGRLKVLGRVGHGIENVDLSAATEFGCLVVNAPRPNTFAAAEHAITLMASMSQADASSVNKTGEWERKKHVEGKTLAVFGLGKVGTEVARRAKGLGMRVIARDPFITSDRAQAIGVDLVSLSEALSTADFISLHLPLTLRTWLTLADDAFAQMKKGVCIVNVSHGGLIFEDALVKALDSGIVSQAALDVFREDYFKKYTKILQHERVTVIPHLAASTMEAQEGVSTDLAQAVVGALNGQGELLAATAVNAPMFSAEVPTELKPYVVLAEVLGRMVVQLALKRTGGVKNVKITYTSARATDDLDTRLLRAKIIKGIMEPISSDYVYINLVNAEFIAKQRGMRLSEERVLVDGSPDSPLETIALQLDNVDDSLNAEEFKVEGRVKDGKPCVMQFGTSAFFSHRNCVISY